MNDTISFWSGEFGDQYIKRNRFDWRKRIPFWDGMVGRYGFRSAYEVGCNVGYNLTAIKHSIYGYNVQLYGEDINTKALHIAEVSGHHEVYRSGECEINDGAVELVFTSGVLIHVAPDDLPAMMQKIVDLSCDYVLAIEYEADTETEVEYRGHSGKLWKRPYGRMYEEMGLTMVETGKLGGQDGFDPNGVTYWLLKK